MSARIRPCAIVQFDDGSRVMLVCACGKCLRYELARPVGVRPDGRIEAYGHAGELFVWLLRRCPEMVRPNASCAPPRPRPKLEVVR